jgi:uncharacterized cupin superfamily protein
MSSQAGASSGNHDGTTDIEPGDAFLFKPGEPHQLINNGSQDLILYVVADNPIGESTYYPDSRKMGRALTGTPDTPVRSARIL